MHVRVYFLVVHLSWRVLCGWVYYGDYLAVWELS